MNVLEDREGFREKLANCMSERYWQFYGHNIYMRIKEVSGPARPVRIRGWSRKEGRWKEFAGVTGELVLEFEEELGPEEARGLAICRYGVGRYKNQGFGSLRPKGGWEPCS